MGNCLNKTSKKSKINQNSRQQNTQYLIYDNLYKKLKLIQNSDLPPLQYQRVCDYRQLNERKLFKSKQYKRRPTKSSIHSDNNSKKG